MADPGGEASARPSRPRWLGGTIGVLEDAQDYVAGVVGIILVILAAVLIVSGIVTFIHNMANLSSRHTAVDAAATLLDQLLLVLIVAEIVHTVVLSLRTHELSAQPFIVVGLIAVIRKILLDLSAEASVSNAELALLIGMVVAFVAGLIAVSRFEKKDE
jgi:uncharacterized membrane protein (DUF373 family)